MNTEYPDILGDLIEARARFEVNGVHYMAALDPATIAPGETTSLRLWLQSCWDVPIQAAISVHLSTSPSEGLSVIQRQTDVPLQAGEVGELRIPIATAAGLGPGEHSIPLTVGVSYEIRGLYVRSQKSAGQLDDPALSFTTGMGLSASMGLGFVAHTQPEQELTLQVAGPPQQLPPPDLTPTFVSLWTVDDMLIEGKVRRYVYDQKIFFLPKITREALYRTFLEESQVRYKEAGLPLQIGEAIFAAKALTYAVEHFLRHPDWQDAILIPAYTLAYRYDLPIIDPVSLVARADYARGTRLACSLAFGLLRQRLKRDLWTLEEQLAVADLVANRVERGGTLPAEFLYLPLILGGLLVADRVTMPGEKVAQSLELLARARQKRRAELAENPELVALLDRLIHLLPR